MLWSKERGINFTMPSRLSENGTSPEASEIPAQTGEETRYQIAGTINAAQNQTSQNVSSSQAATAAGNWSFRLKDSKNRIMALTLFQSDDAVFGTGTINDGGDTLRVSASGSVQGDKLNLDVTSSGTVTLYRIVLTINGNYTSGEYRAFSTRGEPWIGLADGMRTVSDYGAKPKS
jgi:hypothetical protein